MTIPTPQSVELRFKDIAGLTMEKVAKIQRATFLNISARVIDKTPVDTGRARSGWFADVETFNTGTNEEQRDKRISAEEASQRSINSALSATARHAVGQDLTLANSVEYIQYLNSGSSKQAPAGMTDSVINDFKTFVEDATRGAK